MNRNFLIKPGSSACNLRCRYCFYEDESSLRETPNLGRMSWETAEKLIRQAFEGLKAGDGVAFTFQGGEPTVMGLDFYRMFTQKADALSPNGVHITYAMQTNGTLLDEEWADFFLKYNFLVGISIDGTQFVHDTWRVDAAGHGTWDTIVKNVKMLFAKGVPINAVCVVTKNSARHPGKIYESLRALGFDYLQFIACLDPKEKPRGTMPWSLTPDAYGKFLCGVFDGWYEDWRSGRYVSVRLFEDYGMMMLGQAPSTCAACGICGNYTVVEGDGSLYPCDFYCMDEWKMGMIGEEGVLDGEMKKKFLNFGIARPAECLTCPYRRICNGGCKNDWYYDSDGKPHNYFCRSFQTFFRYAGDRLYEAVSRSGVNRA